MSSNLFDMSCSADTFKQPTSSFSDFTLDTSSSPTSSSNPLKLGGSPPTPTSAQAGTQSLPESPPASESARAKRLETGEEDANLSRFDSACENEVTETAPKKKKRANKEARRGALKRLRALIDGAEPLDTPLPALYKEQGDKSIVTTLNSAPDFKTTPPTAFSPTSPSPIDFATANIVPTSDLVHIPVSLPTTPIITNTLETSSPVYSFDQNLPPGQTRLQVGDLWISRDDLILAVQKVYSERGYACRIAVSGSGFVKYTMTIGCVTSRAGHPGWGCGARVIMEAVKTRTWDGHWKVKAVYNRHFCETAVTRPPLTVGALLKEYRGAKLAREKERRIAKSAASKQAATHGQVSSEGQSFHTTFPPIPAPGIRSSHILAPSHNATLISSTPTPPFIPMHSNPHPTPVARFSALSNASKVASSSSSTLGLASTSPSPSTSSTTDLPIGIVLQTLSAFDPYLGILVEQNDWTPREVLIVETFLKMGGVGNLGF